MSDENTEKETQSLGSAMLRAMLPIAEGKPTIVVIAALCCVITAVCGAVGIPIQAVVGALLQMDKANTNNNTNRELQ